MIYDEPIWTQKGRALRQYPWMDGNVRTQACVIGGGLTGTLCALRLAREGAQVTLLTQRPIGHGLTSRMLPVSLCDCGRSPRAFARRAGRDATARMLRLTQQAADDLEDICRDFSGGAGFARRDCVIYAAGETDADQLRRDCEEYLRAGVELLEMNRSAFGSAFAFPAHGAVVLPNGAVEADPYLLAQYAAAHAADMGAIIFENTKAERISSLPDGGVSVFTSTRRTVTADCVVIAAGASCSEILTGMTAGRTRYIAASRPVRSFCGWPGRCAIRSYSEPDIICASSPDGRLVISSAASPGADSRERLRDALRLPAAGHRRYTELEDAARYLFPEAGVSKFDAGWTIRGARTADGLPIVGRTRSHPGCVFAVSGGEEGALASTLLSRVAVDEALGREPEEIRLFTPGRRRLAG